MGIIYMDFYYNRRDDMILSMSPLHIIYHTNKTNTNTTTTTLLLLLLLLLLS